MKKVVILSVMVCSILLSETTTTGRYGVTDNVYQESLQKMREQKRITLEQQEEYKKKIKELTDFMDNVKELSSKHKEEARLFQLYVEKHMEGVAACKNLEADFELEKNEGISREDTEDYLIEIDDCKIDAKKNQVSYQEASNFFDKAEESLEGIKRKTKFAQKRYERLKKNLEETRALVEFLEEASN